MTDTYARAHTSETVNDSSNMPDSRKKQTKSFKIKTPQRY